MRPTFTTAVIELTGSKSKVVHRPLPQDDPRQRPPDISKARQMLNWEPTNAAQGRIDENDYLF